MPSSALLLVAAACALWPVWRWMAGRAADPGEGWELCALVAALLVLVLREPAKTGTGRALWLPSLLLLCYAASYPFLLPLPRAALGLAALAAALSRLRFGRALDLPFAGLLLLSLPVVASLNFYLGYPMRVAVGKAAALLLQLNGFAVAAEGALLLWNGRAVAIDAPCSGVKMLWTGLFLAFSLAALRGLDASRTCALALIAMLAVLASNVLRAAALFYVESGVLKLPADWHAEIGIAAFCAAAFVIAQAAARMRPVPHAPHAPHAA